MKILIQEPWAVEKEPWKSKSVTVNIGRDLACAIDFSSLEDLLAFIDDRYAMGAVIDRVGDTWIICERDWGNSED